MHKATLLLGGRGSGKTTRLAKWCDEKAMGRAGRTIHFVAKDMASVVQLALPRFKEHCAGATWSASRCLLTWPNGSSVRFFGADDPESLRGPTCEYAAVDDLSDWTDPTTLELVRMGLRKGDSPEEFIATTPTPESSALLVSLSEVAEVLHARTVDNPAVARSFVAATLRKYGDTEQGRMALNGEL